MSGQEESSTGASSSVPMRHLVFSTRSLSLAGYHCTRAHDDGRPDNASRSPSRLPSSHLSQSEGDFNESGSLSWKAILHARDGYSLKRGQVNSSQDLASPHRTRPKRFLTLRWLWSCAHSLLQTLLEAPECLLLDEPTNHLDIYSIRWLEKFLQGYRGVVIVVSHDRRFLQNTCTDILDIDYQTITHYPKAYDQAHLMKAERREQWEKERERKEKEIADKQAFVDEFKAKATKNRQAQSRVKQLEKITVEDLPETSITPHFKIPSSVKQAKISCVSKGYKTFGPKTVLKDVSFNIRKGDRVAIVGANGIGKSTLLKNSWLKKFSKT